MVVLCNACKIMGPETHVTQKYIKHDLKREIRKQAESVNPHPSFIFLT
jgi:hypothetical protein